MPSEWENRGLRKSLLVIGLLWFYPSHSLAEALRRASDPSTPEIVAGTGANEDEAIRNALRLAISQRCGTTLKEVTVETRNYDRSMGSGASVQLDESYEEKRRRQLATSTGGVVKSYELMNSDRNEKQNHTVVLRVFVEKCLADKSSRISIVGNRVTNSREPEKRPKVSPNAFVEKMISVQLRFRDPYARMNQDVLREASLPVAKSFAINLAKSMVLGRPYADVSALDVRSELNVQNSRYVSSNAQDSRLEMDSTVVLFGVMEEVDGTGAAAFDATDSALEMEVAHSSSVGITFLVNPLDQSLVVLEVERKGRALGKLLRGDVIELIDSSRPKVDGDIAASLNTAVDSGPVRMTVRRGLAKSMVVIR